MYFDTLTLAAVVAELRATILDGRIQRVRLPNQQSVALDIYAHGRRRHLLLSAHPQFARVHLNSARLSRGVEVHSPLLLLLRKYVVGGRISAVDQPDLERIIILSIVKGPHLRNTPIGSELETEAPEEADDLEEIEQLDEALRCELIIEVMERRSNIMLVSDENIILESVRRVTPAMSRRPVQPREPYELPPRQDKRDPRNATPEGLQSLQEQNGDLARAIVGAYRGVSPQAAREVVFRCLGRTDASLGPDLPWQQLATTLRSLWNEPAQPCLALDNGEPKAYAPYLLTHYPHVESQPGMSAALETYYAAREQLTSHQQRRDALALALNETRARFVRQQQQLLGELEQTKQLEHLRWEGEMIFAFLHQITPGQTSLEVEGQTIALNPDRTPVENAQERFKAYDKAKGALANVPERLQATEAQLAGIDELLALLSLAESYEQIEDLGQEAIELGYIRTTQTRKPKVRRQAPLRLSSSDGFTIYVGRSARQNEQVTFQIGGSDDLWLHVRGIPGAHVIIKSGGREAPERTVLEAAGVAAYFSQARTEAAVDVEISRRRLVRRVSGGPPGLVTYRAERTVRVAPKLKAES
jgi:predicted ribosome quality control (RQC) complex YloA/Tae2 family protein